MLGESRALKQQPTATTFDMQARSDDINNNSANPASAAAPLANQADDGFGEVNPATVEAMEAGAALSPPPSPRASVDKNAEPNNVSTFAFDTARLSSRSSPPRSPPGLASSKKAQEKMHQPDRVAPAAQEQHGR